MRRDSAISAEARRLGFDVRKTRRGHLCFRHPLGGPPVYAASTSSDVRGHKNTMARLRRVLRTIGKEEA